METTKRLTAKQKRFVEEYLVDLNASRAALRAGYTRAEAGRRLVTQSHVSEAIKYARKERSERTQVTQDRVLQEEACIAFSDIRDLFDEQGELIPKHELPERVRSALSSYDVSEKIDRYGNQVTNIKIKFWDKGRALERVSRHLGMYEKDNTQGGQASGQAMVEAYREILREVDGATRGLPNKTQKKIGRH